MWLTFKLQEAEREGREKGAKLAFAESRSKQLTADLAELRELTTLLAEHNIPIPENAEKREKRMAAELAELNQFKEQMAEERAKEEAEMKYLKAWLAEHTEDGDQTGNNWIDELLAVEQAEMNQARASWAEYNRRIYEEAIQKMLQNWGKI